MKVLLSIVAVVGIYLVFTRAYAPAPTLLSDGEKKVLVENATALLAAFEKGDAEAIIAGTHPAIFNLVSREEFERTARQSTAALSQTVTTVSRTWGEPRGIYASGSDEVCFVPSESILVMAGKRAHSKGFLIAARKKGTKAWLFLDGAGLRKNPEVLWKFFPGFPKDVVLPSNKVELIQ
ncbi:MAG: hypothetical protein ACAH88_06260 [Roseimicrobium sp.]